jgi:hypothetical protein
LLGQSKIVDFVKVEVLKRVQLAWLVAEQLQPFFVHPNDMRAFLLHAVLQAVDPHAFPVFVGLF